jgi:hypothetical protein
MINEVFDDSTVQTSPPRPKAISVIPENIPEDLKNLNQWLLWRYESNGNRWTKPPYGVSGYRIDPTDSSKWNDFGTVLDHYQAGQFDGVGLALKENSGIVGFDLDHCRNRSSGKIDEWAVKVLDQLNSYSEISPSGEGIRIFVHGSLPDVAGLGRKKGNIEIYSGRRYFTVTGHKIDKLPGIIAPRQEEITNFINEYFSESNTSQDHSQKRTNPNSELSDEEIIEIASAAKNGAKFKRLFKGESQGYPSPSEADLALCSILAFWTSDLDQIDRLYRRSHLFRPKWDEKHGLRTYGHETILEAIRKVPTHYKPSMGPYGIQDGRLVRVKTGRDGSLINEPLCNFIANITEEIIYDHGHEVSGVDGRIFTVSGTLDSGVDLGPIQVPASKFSSMAWVTEQWGAGAVVCAGRMNRDYLREAIQRSSSDRKKRHVYKHTGWTKVDGELLYITADGPIGSEKNVEVDLDQGLSRYCLPRFPKNPVEAVRASLQLLEIGPFTITAPLFAVCFRAPLAEFLTLDCSLWLEGLTGSLKSTIAGLFLSHYGNFDGTHLPGCWTSTYNHLERTAFLLKDVPLVVDDYAPSPIDQRELEKKASYLLRSQGNLNGRGRLKQDLSIRAAHSPRGFIIATGEQHPSARSIIARTAIIEVEKQFIDLNRLSSAQASKDLLPHSMSAYIAWLTGQTSDLQKRLRDEFNCIRAKFHSNAAHLRIPEILTNLWIGFDMGVKFAEQIGACNQSTAKDLRKQGWDAFMALGQKQHHLIEEERPTRRYLQILVNILTQNPRVLLPKDEPISCEDSDMRGRRSEILGWFDEESLYLLPEAAFRAVAEFSKESGEPFPIKDIRLRRDLKNEGITETDSDHMTATVRIGEKTKRVLKLNRAKIKTHIDQDLPLPDHLINTKVSEPSGRASANFQPTII